MRIVDVDSHFYEPLDWLDEHFPALAKELPPLSVNDDTFSLARNRSPPFLAPTISLLHCPSGDKWTISSMIAPVSVGAIRDSGFPESSAFEYAYSVSAAGLTNKSRPSVEVRSTGSGRRR